MSDRKDEMHYEAMAQEALRGVIKAALRRAASPEGLPGEHHLYVSFQTRAPGVSVPPDLSARYPEEMTIVLQNQFWDLAPGETFFSVMLKFGGQAKKLSVPYAAVTRLHDPSVGFALQFEPGPVREHERRGRDPAPAHGQRTVGSGTCQDRQGRPASPMAMDPRSSPSTSSGRSELTPKSTSLRRLRQSPPTRTSSPASRTPSAAPPAPTPWAFTSPAWTRRRWSWRLSSPPSRSSPTPPG